jgi:glycosyltransferase involved in cell wall biosynthesis
MRVLRIYHAGRDPAHRERERALVRAGIDVTLVVPTEWPGPDDVGDEPFEVIGLSVRRPGDVNRHTYVEPSRIRTLIDELQPDVVDLHEEPFSSVVHQLLRVIPDRLPVVTYAAQNIDKRFPPPFAQWERRALSRVSGVYPCSKQAASVLVGKGFRGAVRVLPLGVAPQITRGRQRLPAETLELLLVGRLVPEKGVTDAVHVLAALQAKHSMHLTLAGVGPEGDAAQRLAAELGVRNRLTVEPWLAADELARRYRKAHVLLAPSRTTRTWVEQFGRMVVEGQAAGAVVVGYASGSLPEVVGEAGVLVPEGDAVALVDAVRALVDEPEYWARLRKRSLADARRCTWDAIATGQIELYAQVAKDAPRRVKIRPRRPRAVADFGAPADVAGGGRPFALPVLREDNRATRALAKAIDALARRSAAPNGERLKVVYLDHVARMSGGELALLRLIEALPDVDAHVILGEDGDLRPALEAIGATVEVLPLDPGARDVRRAEAVRLGSLRAAAITAAYTVRVARRLRALRPDIVHTNSLKSGYYGSVAARLARVPVIWHLRDRIADDYLPPGAVRLTRALLRVLPDLVVCNSAETLRTAGQHVRAGAIVGSPVVHDPYARREPSLAPRVGNVIGIVGRLAEWKGQHVFLRALAELRREFPDARGRIVGSAMFGEDAYEERLRALVDELALGDAVTFTGFVPRVEDELAKLDVLVHASVVPEPFGQVVVEGMAAGLPVVATNAGGPAEVITDGVDGLLVPPGDVRAMASALRRLTVDLDLRARLGAAATVTAEEFSPEVIGRQMRALYDELRLRS